MLKSGFQRDIMLSSRRAPSQPYPLPPPFAPLPVFPKGPFTILIEESIAHDGAPFKITLSAEGDDETGCVLLDHIPSNPSSRQ